jgi:hypothetical protein
VSREEEDTCVSHEEEDTCVSHEEEDTCVSYEEEDTCVPYAFSIHYGQVCHMRRRIHVCDLGQVYLHDGSGLK